jgi:hypothetical protein
VELFAGAVWLACLQLGRLAVFAVTRHIAKRGASIFTSTRGRKPLPRAAA